MDKVDNFNIFKDNQEVVVGTFVDKKFSLTEKRTPVRALFKHLIDLPILQKGIPSLG